MKFPMIMESRMKYVWMISESKGPVIKLKEESSHQTKVGEFGSGWYMDHFKECNDPAIEIELLKLILIGVIKRK